MREIDASIPFRIDTASCIGVREDTCRIRRCAEQRYYLCITFTQHEPYGLELRIHVVNLNLPSRGLDM